MAHEPIAQDYRQSLHASVVATAGAVIASKLSVVEASHRFMELAAELDALDDADFAYFIALDSQSDGFPVGAAREHWNRDALEREDLARHQFEGAVLSEAVSHCRGLIDRYSPRG
jgi:hypothetical protein